MSADGPSFRDEFNQLTSRGIGAVAGLNIVAEEFGNGFMHQTVLSITNRQVTVANTTGASFGGQKLYDFPLGRICIVGGTVKLPSIIWTGTGIGAGGSGDVSLGTTITADATLSTTDVDIMASTALLDPFVLGVGSLVSPPAPGVIVKTTEFDGSATAKDLNWNWIVDDADVADADSSIITVSGEIHITWFNHYGN